MWISVEYFGSTLNIHGDIFYPGYMGILNPPLIISNISHDLYPMAGLKNFY